MCNLEQREAFTFDSVLLPVDTHIHTKPKNTEFAPRSSSIYDHDTFSHPHILSPPFMCTRYVYSSGGLPTCTEALGEASLNVVGDGGECEGPKVPDGFDLLQILELEEGPTASRDDVLGWASEVMSNIVEPRSYVPCSESLALFDFKNGRVV